MARKNKNNSPDPFSQMYEQQLRKFESMDTEGTPAGQDDLHFYTEEELEAIEQAKRDAARQAYQDAYLDEYNKTRRQVKNTRERRNEPQKAPQGKRRHASSSSSMYARQAREQAKKNRGDSPVQFGANNPPPAKKKGGNSVAGGIFKFVFAILLVLLLLMQRLHVKAPKRQLLVQKLQRRLLLKLYLMQQRLNKRLIQPNQVQMQHKRRQTQRGKQPVQQTWQQGVLSLVLGRCRM